MPDFIQPHPSVSDVQLVHIKAFSDERGRFREAFRREWFPDTDFSRVQSNHSESKAGVLRGLHYHMRQVDYWYVTRGMIRVGLADLRPSSPSFRQAATLDIGDDASIGVYIPEGVAHGFYALTDASLIYYVNQYYDGGSDEHGVAWDDPDLGVAWNVSAPPILSPRDVSNAQLRDISADKLPK
jgi:dTDP-4-dehydrorhamnose 3,5-epimerase